VYEHYVSLKGRLDVARQTYDKAAKDFQTIAERMGDPFFGCDKDRLSGFSIINALLKFGILKIYDDGDLKPLVDEMESLCESTAKQSAKDDFCDALRYCIMGIPVNWEEVLKKIKEEGVVQAPKHDNEERELRYRDFERPSNLERELYNSNYEDDFRELNELYGS
jgi:hypothetical protein